MRGGDRYTELGGFTQQCEFDKDLYINPGPVADPLPPSRHDALRQGVCACLSSLFARSITTPTCTAADAFGGKPQRYREVKADYQGHVAELLAKATRQHALDGAVSKEDQEKLLESLREWGALDKNYAYVSSDASSERRGYEKNPGGGLSAQPVPSKPLGLSDVLESGLWRGIPNGDIFDMQTALFQPVGGMGRIGEAFGRELSGRDPLQRKGHRHPSGRTWRHGDFLGQPQPGRRSNRPCGLVRMHHSAAHARADSQ